ncbi:MAG TPA: metalloregulator ArsR/SmtB family transcription factor [Candidatus Eisenbacteria bacterium]|jgi:ArsR family transcriptional regulator
MSPVRTVVGPGSRSGRKPAAANSTDVELARLAKALGHPARVAILRMLAEGGECMCGAIVSRLPLAQATVSQHLKVLKEAGLIQGEIDPPRVCYCIDPEAVKRLQTLVGAIGPAARRTG